MPCGGSPGLRESMRSSRLRRRRIPKVLQRPRRQAASAARL